MTSIRKAKKNFNKRKPIGVFKFNEYLSQDEINHIQKQIQDTFKNDRFIILSGDTDYIPINRNRSNKSLSIKKLR